MTEKFVKPGAPGSVVINPSTGARLPEKGDWWRHDQFLMRRLRDGDVIETAPPSADKPAAPAAKIKE